MIKILACIFMFIDHAGLILFPQQQVLRVIGRLAMPLFAYCIARGCINTQNINKYLFKVLRLAVVSQVPYMLMEKQLKGNICFLWVLGIIAIKHISKNEKIFRDYTVIVLSIVLSVVIPMDYGIYGMFYLLVLYFFGFRKNEILLYGSWVVLHIGKMCLNISTGVIQVFTLPTIPIIDMCNRYGLEKKKLKSKIIDWFYPVHIVFLLLLMYFLKGI